MSLASKSLHSQSHGFSSSYVQMWEMDHKEGWISKNWCFQIMVLEQTPESPLDSKRIKSVNHKRNQPWLLIGRTDAEVVLQYFGQYLANWCIEPTHWERTWCWERLRQEEKGKTEDEMIGWHHWLNEHEFEQTWGDSEGQGSLPPCSSQGHRIRHGLVTEQQQLLMLAGFSYIVNFLGGSDGKASVYNAGDPGSSPGLGISPGGEMSIHSSTIAWKIPWMEEPGRLQSIGLLSRT